MRELIQKVVGGAHLSPEEAERAVELIVEGGATPAQVGSFLTALRMKGETGGEILGAARAMRSRVVRVPHHQERILDTCGTGGDGRGTFNISTAAAFVAAGAGVPVAKHGNRAVSSRAGSADVLEALGVRIELDPEEMGRCLDQVGICFLFAPLLHPSMKAVAAPRREIGIRTIFNLLGPLTNPAGANFQLLGVYSPHLVETMAAVLRELGTERSLVVHGTGGLDEVSLAGPTLVGEASSSGVTVYTVYPEDMGLARAPVEAVLGGTAEENASLIRGVLSGEVRGPKRDVVLANAAAALVAAGAAANFREGVELAARSLDSGEALRKLEALVAASRAGATV